MSEVDKREEEAVSRWMWRAAQALAIWSGIGFWLADTVDPQAVNMGAGVGIPAILLTAAAVMYDWDRNKKH